MELYIKKTHFDTYIIRDGLETLYINTIAKKAQITSVLCKKFLIDSFNAHCVNNNIYFNNKQDAELAIEWIESILLANEMKE